MTTSLTQLFNRDLDRIKDELKLYKSSSGIWVLSGDIKNSAGTLCLHICGNLQHFIGSVLGNSGYVRNRDAEFTDRNLPLDQLISEIELTKKVVESTLSKIDSQQLSATYPIELWNSSFTVEFFLIHLYGHLNWHFGQINYHRRLIS